MRLLLCRDGFGLFLLVVFFFCIFVFVLSFSVGQLVGSPGCGSACVVVGRSADVVGRG